MSHETIAFTQEPDYAAAPGDTTSLDSFGGGVTISDLSLDNAAERLRTPGSADPWETVLENFEGSVTLQGTLTSGNLGWFENVFATAGSPYTFQTGEAHSARWYVGVDPGFGSAERELMGVVIPQAEISCNQGETVQFTLTAAYGDETENTTLTQATPIEPSGDPFVFHGGSFGVGGTPIKLMQSATLTLNSNARMLRGWNRHPTAAIMGGHESQIEPEDIFDASSDMIGVGYGSQGASAPVDYPDDVSASLSFDAPAGSLTANLGGITADGYSWSNAGDVDQNLTEGGTYFIDHPSIATGGS